MPQHASRPTFPVVSLTLVVLAVIGTFSKLAQPKLPPPPPNRLASEPGSFDQAGARQPINWIPYGPEVFETAKALQKPIMLVVGGVWSAPARKADRDIFTDTETAALLGRSFVCARIGAQVHPDAIGAFLPFQRTRFTTDPGFQIVFLDSDGRVYKVLTGLGVISPLNTSGFQQMLLESLETLAQIQRIDALEAPGERQLVDKTRILVSKGQNFPQYSRQDQALAAQADPRYGGFVYRGISYLWPQAFRYLLESGRPNEFKELADPLLRGPHVDWLSGGFFRQVRFEGKKSIEFDKIAAENASLMAIFARYAAVSADHFYRRVAVDTFDFLTRDLNDAGLIAYAQLGDELPNGRSRKSSFNYAELRDRFSDSERRTLAQDFGLDVGKNPMSTIRIQDVLVTESESGKALLQKLQRLHLIPPSLLRTGQASTAGYVIARLIETASVLGDQKRLELAGEFRDYLSPHVSGDDVIPTLRDNMPRNPNLGSYLAFADMNLQWFLASGDGDALLEGLRILARSRFVFESHDPGVYFPTVDSGIIRGPIDARLPEVIDWVEESQLSMIVRLGQWYGQTLRVGGERDVREMAELMRMSSESTARHFSAMSDELAMESSGFFSSSLVLIDPTQIYVVGSESVEQARLLRSLLPGRIVVPAIGPVRTDLQAKTPGVYVVRGGVVSGPLKPEAAASTAAKTFAAEFQRVFDEGEASTSSAPAN